MMQIDYDHHRSDDSIIGLIESVCEKVQLATTNCTSVKYAFMAWSGETLLTMYLKPGIVLNIRVTLDRMYTSYVIDAFKQELIRKYW